MNGIVWRSKKALKKPSKVKKFVIYEERLEIKINGHDIHIKLDELPQKKTRWLLLQPNRLDDQNSIAFEIPE